MNVDCVWHGDRGSCEGDYFASACVLCGMKFMACLLAHSEHDTCWSCIAYPIPKQEEPKEVTE